MPDDRPIIPPIVRVAQTGHAAASAINDRSKNNAQAQATVAGSGSVLPIIYGTRRVGAKVGVVIVYQNDLLVLAAWCRGEVDAVSEFCIDDKPPADSGLDITSRTYRGLPNQAPDPTLVAAFAAKGQTYNDALPNVCYSVFRIKPTDSGSFPRLSAKIRGMKIRSTEAGARAYNENPALCIADFIESAAYGMGRLVDWASVATTAAACDALVGGETKRRVGVALDTPQTGEAWLQVLRDYAGCWIVPEGNLYRLVPDVPGSSVQSFTAANIVEKSVKLDKRGTSQAPTCVEVTYTDTTQVPWRDATVTVYAAGVLAGTVPRRMSRLQKPGIFRHSEANRYAIERLNDAVLNDLSIAVTAFDDGIALQVGDIIDVTHPIGLSAKLFRVLKAEPKDPGRWSISAQEYDPAKYSSAVVNVPSQPDSTFPDPFNPPAVTGLVATEDLYQSENGTWASRIRLTWDAASYPYTSGYSINVYEGGVLKETSLSSVVTSYLTKPLREDTTYTATVAVFSSLGALGTAAAATLTTRGKTAIPGNVPTFTGFEAGGRVFLYWTAAADLDIWRYELRYGATSGSWDTAKVIDVVDALAYEAAGLPSGPWRFYVKAVDSIRQYSAIAKTLDITVSLDSAFLLGTKNMDELGAPTLANMTRFDLRADPLAYYITDFGDPLNFGYTNPDNATGTFADDGRINTPWVDPHTAGTSSYLSPTWDIGQTLTGNFTATVPYTDISGTALAVVETSPDGSAWTAAPGLGAKAAARFTRFRVSSTGSFLMRSGGTIRVDALTKTEQGLVTTNASGPTVVALVNKYAAAKSIQLTPQGTTPRSAVYDNVIVSASGTNSFDVYLFNSSLAQISGQVSWVFEGI